jgi:CHAD domain
VRRILEEVDATPEGAEREELLHDARKAAKRARHAAESVSRIFGADAIAFAEAKEAVQEALGKHQDSVLTRERLRELARHTSSTEAAFFYGRVQALEEAGQRSPRGTSTQPGRPRGASPCTAGCADRGSRASRRERHQRPGHPLWVRRGGARPGERMRGSPNTRAATLLVEVR